MQHSTIVETSDRRRAYRARLAAAVTTTIGHSLVDAVGADLSVGGIRLVAARHVEIGQQIELVFFLKGEIVSAAGVVRWTSRTPRGLYAFGVAFTSIEDDGGAVVSSFCQAMS